MFDQNVCSNNSLGLALVVYIFGRTNLIFIVYMQTGERESTGGIVG